MSAETRRKGRDITQGTSTFYTIPNYEKAKEKNGRKFETIAGGEQVRWEPDVRRKGYLPVNCRVTRNRRFGWFSTNRLPRLGGLPFRRLNFNSWADNWNGWSISGLKFLGKIDGGNMRMLRCRIYSRIWFCVNFVIVTFYCYFLMQYSKYKYEKRIYLHIRKYKYV